MLVLGKWKGLKEDQEFKTNLGYIRRPPNLQNQRNKQTEEFPRMPGKGEAYDPYKV